MTTEIQDARVPSRSPALTHQTNLYPPNFRGRVPLKIKMACTVHPDLPAFSRPGTVAVKDEVYEVWVNQNGAVAAICKNGERLGVKPSEFDIIEWHPAATASSAPLR